MIFPCFDRHFLIGWASVTRTKFVPKRRCVFHRYRRPIARAYPNFVRKRQGSNRNGLATTVVNPSGSDTNTTFTALLCNELYVSTTNVIVNAFPGLYFVLPSCLSTASSLSIFQGSNLIIGNFAYFPASVTSLDITNSKFISSQTASNGYNTDGTIAWTQIYGFMASLNFLSLTNSGINGTLPSIPSTFYTFNVSHNAFSGAIPSTLFFTYPGVSPLTSLLNIDLSHNPLGGSIPEGLFAPFASTIFSQGFAFYADNIGLTGSLPVGLLDPLNSGFVTPLTLSLTSNQLTGTLPSSGLIPPNFASVSVLSIYLQNNRIEGDWPSNFFENVTTFSTFNFNLSTNQLTGDLPESLFPLGRWTPYPLHPNLTFDISNNGFGGTIPESFLTGGLTSNASFYSLIIDLSKNSLTSDIPEQLLWTPSSSTTGSLSASVIFSLSLSYNQLSGSLPTRLLQNAFELYGASADGYASFDVSGNDGILGTIPPAFMDSMALWMAAGSSTLMTATLNIGKTQIHGALPAACSGSKRFSYLAPNTPINGSFPNSWQSCIFGTIDVTSTAFLQVSIPSSLLSTTSRFLASNSALQGTLPLVGSSLTTLILTDDTGIDFCSAPSNSAFASSGLNVSTCSLIGTTACICQQYFPAICVSGCATSPALVSPPPAPTTCFGTQPSPDFSCSGGIWTATSTNSSVLTIASGSSPTVVTGNLGSSSIVFQGVGSTVTVEGCANNLTSIHIELSESQAEAIKQLKTLQTLLSQNISGCVDLSNVALSISVKNGGCKKARVSKVVSDGGSTLGGLFTLDTSGCNRWWIILVSVICGVILVAVIVVILVAIFSPRFRTAIRPFSKRRAATGTV